MKNLRKFLAIILSITMVMCSTLPSVASEIEVIDETTKSKIEEQLRKDLGEERANEILNVGVKLGEPEEEEEEITSVGANVHGALPEEEEESEYEETESVETNETTVVDEEVEETTLAEPEEETEETTAGSASVRPYDEEVEEPTATPSELSEIDEEETGTEETTMAEPVELEISIASKSITDKTLYGVDEPWMYWYLTDDDGDSTFETIHFSSTDPGGATGINCGPNDEIEYVGLGKDDITKAVFENEINAVTCKKFFYYFDKLTNIENLTKLETGNVISMSGMFYHCESLSSIDLSKFNTGNVEDMFAMFAHMELSIKELDLKSFNTENVTDMGGMFIHCNVLEKILVSTKFNTTKVVKSENMFNFCLNLTGEKGTTYKDSNPKDITYARIDEGTSNPGYFTRAPWMYWYLTYGDTFIHFSSTDPGGANPISNEIEVDYPMGLAKSNIEVAVFDNEINAVTCRGFFAGFTGLTEIRGPGTLKTNNVKDMTNMFYNCQRLNYLSIYWDTSNVEDMTNMFGNCQSLDAVGFYNFDTSKVKTMNKMFENCESLDHLHLEKFDTSNVTTMASMFKNCKTLDNLNLSSNFTTAEVTDMESMFESCERLNNPDLSSFNTSKVTNMKSMFKGCTRLVKLDLTGFDTSNVELMEKMFYGCSSLMTIMASDEFRTTKVSDDGADMFSACNRLVGCYGTAADTSLVYNKGYAHIDEGTSNRGYFSSAPWMYWYLTDSNQTIHYTSSKPTSGDYEIMTRRDGIVYNGLGITDIGAITKAEFDNNVTAVTCRAFFNGFSSMVDIVNLNKLDTQNVARMVSMFANCSQLDSLDLSNFNTSNVTSMGYMFYNCSSLTSLDLNKFDTSNVENTQYMFYGCSSLTKIRVSNSFVTTSVTWHDNMFTNCTNLVGGAGTTYDSNKVDAEYARIDEGTAAPGYFTLYVPPTPPAPTPTYPQNYSSDRDGGGGGSIAGPLVDVIIPAVTYLPIVKNILATLNNTTSKWTKDTITNKHKLNIINQNGTETPATLGFYNYTNVVTHIVNNVPVQTQTNDTYVFDDKGNMITGWVRTADGKWYLFEYEKTTNEGKMVIGWKKVQGAWYYFGTDGAMLTNAYTPDGHYVGPDGKWVG